MKKLKVMLKPSLKKILYSLTLVFLMTGCSSTTTSYLPPMAQSLRQPCQTPGVLANGQADTVYRLLVDNAADQLDCGQRHAAVVNLYDEMRKVINGTK